MMKRIFIFGTATLFLATSIIFISCQSTEFEDGIQTEESAKIFEPERFEEIAAGRTKVTFKTDVPKAALYINNEFHGLTPLEIHNLIPGKYFVTIKRRGYKTVEIAIEIKDGISDYYYIEMEIDDSEQEQ